MSAGTIEYYFALASPWSYLGNDRLREIAAAHGAVVDPVIVDYDSMFAAAGTVPLPERPPLRKAYRLVELRRWSRVAARPAGAGAAALSGRGGGAGRAVGGSHGPLRPRRRGWTPSPWPTP